MAEDAPMNIGAALALPHVARQKVLRMQAKLHCWAAADRGRRFDDLYNLVADPCFLAVAWVRVRENTGARSAGIDKRTARYIENSPAGVVGFLEDRQGSAEHTSFTFLGYTFRAREAPNKNGVVFTSFLPAVSKDALKKMGHTVRRWKLHRRSDLSFTEIARMINPVIRGWMRYYGALYPTALTTLLARINSYLLRWIRKTYKRYRAFKAAMRAWTRAQQRYPHLFAHWRTVPQVLPIKIMGAG